MELLETDRLKLLPFSLDLMKAVITEKAKLGELLGVRVPDAWPGTDIADALPFFVKEAQNNPSGTVWAGLIIHKADCVLIGDMGFHGGPDEYGLVEIGYSIVPEYRNQGYATEMARGLIIWAFQQPDIEIIAAEVHKDNAASVQVLSHIEGGMFGSSEEPDMRRWELFKHKLNIEEFN